MNEKIANLMQVASLRRYTMTEGVSKGLDVIDCDNGCIRFLLNVTKGLDVMQLYHEGQNVSFVSKNGFVAQNLPFGKRFEGGMLYTCGLDSVGGREGFEPHGTYHITPAEILTAQCDENGIVVEALIKSTALCGSHLVMRRKITCAVGENTLHLEDTLTNNGFVDAQYGILYHINVGYPMLDDGAKIEADAYACTPRNEIAVANEGAKFIMTDSVIGEEELCYFLHLNKPQVTLVNNKIGKKFTVTYSGDTLPQFLEWKSMASGDYALGLEPCTTILDDKFEYSKLAAGEKINFFIELKVTEI
jgi:hypothetical protein